MTEMNAMQNEPALDAKIVIIGGGPVGLSTAVDLAWRGQRPLLLEKGDGTVDHPRAGGFTARTMEICRRWGIADNVRKFFNPDFPLNQRFCTSVSGFVLGTARLGTLRQMATPPETPEQYQRCRQMYFDPILRDRAIALGADLRYRQEVTKVTDRSDHIECEIVDLASGNRSTVRCGYLIACDGGRSEVRERLGIDMPGQVLNYSLSILLKGDLLQYAGSEPAERFILISPSGPWANITSMDGYNKQWRLILRFKERPDLDTFDPQEAIRKAVSPDAKLEVESILPWRRANLVADKFQVGRIFLAGDSAHVMTPTGGFGANTGIGDAVDLSWKLDAVLNGWGGDALLDTYEVERRPTAFRNIREAERNHRAWTPDTDISRIDENSPEAEAIRRRVGESMIVASWPEWNSIGVALGYAYLDSPICVLDGSPPPPDKPETYIPTARPGHRAPHAWLKDGRSTLDLFGKGFVLLCFRQVDETGAVALSAAAKAREMPLIIERIDDPAIARLYAQPLVLIRPDGHVAWRGSKLPEPGDLLDIVRGQTIAKARRTAVEAATLAAQDPAPGSNDIAA